MADYISREALRTTYTKWRNIQAKIDDDYGYGLMDDVLRELNAQPTADVAPVRHVRRTVWGIDEYYGAWLICPNCGYGDNAVNAKYCGGCGAKMDLGDEK